MAKRKAKEVDPQAPRRRPVTRKVFTREYDPRIKPTEVLEIDVVQAARARMLEAYERFDNPVVTFSGGKDSTVVLNLAIEAAEATGNLPVKAIFFDEEAVHPTTIEYVHRVDNDPRVDLRWICMPIQHVNACSPAKPYWHPWHPDEKDVWVRPLPKAKKLVTLDNYRDYTYWPEYKFAWDSIPLNNYLFFPKDRTSVILSGIRASESLRRHFAVASRVLDNWLSVHKREHQTTGPSVVPWVSNAYPIYDWKTHDVWLAPQAFGWDYNRTYDLLEWYGIPRDIQRVAPPFGEQPMVVLHMYQVCFPEMWDKMVRRVPGAATAARYSETFLYAFKDMHKPDSLSWKDMILMYLLRHPEWIRVKVAFRIEQEIGKHAAFAQGEEMPEEVSHPISGCSWKFLAKIACRGDFKKRKNAVKAEAGEMIDHLEAKEAGEDWYYQMQHRGDQVMRELDKKKEAGP